LCCSVATVDYDYSKAYGGAGDTSVVSSAGGTMGDTTRQSAGDVAAVAAARAALGASFDSDGGGRGGGGAAGAAVYREDSNVKEEIIEIDAPAGKLGVVIDTPDDGAPVVHAVKDSSVIADQICVGDKLIAVDDEDVRSMTAIKVSKLISKKSANPSRKLTIVRTTYIDDP
jgi:PDZ domain